MIFITQQDLNTVIYQDILNIISDSNSVDTAELTAIEQAKGYLRNRFDCDLIFDSGSSYNSSGRNPLLVMYICDLMIWHLYAAVAPNKISESRINRRDIAVEWLKDVARGISNPAFPIKQVGSPAEELQNSRFGHTCKNSGY